MKADDLPPTAYNHDDDGCATSEVHRHRCSTPDGVGSEGAETIAAESGCRGSGQSYHHGCRDLDVFSVDQDCVHRRPLVT
jgi:hypothetical protein